MTEVEWLACSDLRPMLQYLQGKASDRKWRLFVVACCHHLFDSSADENTISALAIADHLATTGPVRSAHTLVHVSAGEAVIDCGASDPIERFRVLRGVTPQNWQSSTGLPPPFEGILDALACFRAGMWRLECLQWLSDVFAHEGLSSTVQATLLRDIIRGAFRPLVFRHSWRQWNDRTVAKLARGVYEERAFDRLPILADALEEAGCVDLDILSHCRLPGLHVPGCWPVDLILGNG